MLKPIKVKGNNNFFSIFLVLIFSFFSVLILNLQYYNLWFLTPIHHIDPWLYWGSSEAYDYLRINFGKTYYFRRWTLVFPNLFFQTLLAPFEAQILIRSIFAFIIIALSNIIIYKNFKSYLSIFIFTFLILFNEYIIRSIGNSYNMGTGCILALIITLFSYLKTQNRILFSLNGVFIGFLMSLLIVTYQWLIFFTPIFFMNYYINQFRFINALNLLNGIILILVGFIFGIFLDYFVGYIIKVNWQNLIWFSYDYHRSLTKSGDFSISLIDFFKHQALSYGSFLVPSILVMILLVINGNLKSFLLLLSVCSIYLLSVVMGGNPLMIYQTNFYLAFLLIFILGGLIYDLTSNKSNYSKLSIIILLILYLVSNYIYDFRSNDYYEKIQYKIYFFTLALFFSFFLITYAVSQFSWLKKYSIFSYSLLLSFAVISMAPPIQIWTQSLRHTMIADELNQRELDSNDARNMINEISAEVRSAAKLNINNRIWILDIRESSGSGWSPIISSFYGLYSALAVGKNPGLVDCSHMNWIMAYPNSVILVYGAENFNSALALVDPLVSHCGSYNYLESKKHPLNAISMSISRK
jgi:hypothetical protein